MWLLQATLSCDALFVGQELISLRELIMANSNGAFSAEHFNAIAPAMSQLRVLGTYKFGSNAVSLVAAAASSPFLEQVEMVDSDETAVLDLLDALCEGRKGAPLCSLKMDGRSSGIAIAHNAISTAVVEGRLRVYSIQLAGSDFIPTGELHECKQRRYR